MSDLGAKQIVHLDCGKYLVRTATVDDASDRWGRWMADNEVSRMLNASAKSLSKSEVTSYIDSFDQKTHLLLGIFQKEPGQILGFLRVDIDTGTLSPPTPGGCCRYGTVGGKRINPGAYKST